MCTYEAMGVERILLGTDYPYEDPKESPDGNGHIYLLEALSLSQEDKDMIYYQNAKQMGFAL